LPRDEESTTYGQGRKYFLGRERQVGVRNFDKNGVSQIVGMMISVHKTASVYERCRIVPENDIRDALQKVEEAIKEQKKKTSVTTMTGRKGRWTQLRNPLKSRTICTTWVQMLLLLLI